MAKYILPFEKISKKDVNLTDEKRGLTTLGKRVVDQMMQKNMIVDIAHANRKTADDILDRVGDYEK